MASPSSPVPAPSPDPFDVKEYVLAHGTYWRVHGTTHPADGFNPCHDARTRFAPVLTDDGTCVLTLYGALTPETAICEVAFHDVPFDTDPKRIFSSSPDGPVPSAATVATAFRLVDLAGFAGLTRAGAHRCALLEGPSRWSDGTVEWARAAHRSGHDRLIWMSRLAPDDTHVFALFFRGNAAGDLTTGTGRDPPLWLGLFRVGTGRGLKPPPSPRLCSTASRIRRTGSLTNTSAVDGYRHISDEVEQAVVGRSEDEERFTREPSTDPGRRGDLSHPPATFGS